MNFDVSSPFTLCARRFVVSSVIRRGGFSTLQREHPVSTNEHRRPSVKQDNAFHPCTCVCGLSMLALHFPVSCLGLDGLSTTIIEPFPFGAAGALGLRVVSSNGNLPYACVLNLTSVASCLPGPRKPHPFTSLRNSNTVSLNFR